MTYSLLARDPDHDRFAVAVVTCQLAVGAFVPHTRAGTGAIATQGETNPLFGSRGLELLASGMPADAVLERLLQEDAGRDFRQVHLLDANGPIAAWTGPQTAASAGHRSAANVSVAGNFLAGAEVLDETLERWLQTEHLPWPERLIAAMRAGQEAGGDRRGRQSAALRIQGAEVYADLDLRVDNAPEPLEELATLVTEARKPYVADFSRATPCRAEPGRTPDSADPQQPLPY